MKVKHVDQGGLKSNWREFVDFVKSNGTGAFFEYFFVFHEHECDEAYIFEDSSELDKWLEREFHEGHYYEAEDLENSMDEWKVWGLVPESSVEKFPSLYEEARKTSIVIDGETFHRKAATISVEETVLVSASVI
ncbi:hypothetical protein GNK15_11805 [Bacillus amyloliquefaciens]|uniref:hypothetical protein n=1 Tax=Bacillus amyloliquefaciens group TaxID=1938374 RepID=UPI001419F652|nr:MULTISPECIES: hypothetical protein [Bacillus amyloliquefaciens group]MBI0441933.1 hypothetical protein [Bacillus velezensis]NIH01631.1 hypothetical protein [Bacillus amyloliquefaciens]NIH01681.1 hypothetical protein [Bacillus amyloliquefaciens]